MDCTHYYDRLQVVFFLLIAKKDDSFQQDELDLKLMNLHKFQVGQVLSRKPTTAVLGSNVINGSL